MTLAEPYLLYPAADGQSLLMWDLDNIQNPNPGRLEGHDQQVTIVSARGSLAVSCQDSGPVRARVWNMETRQCTAMLPGGQDDTEILSACCMEGSALLGLEDGIIKVWDVAASTPVALADLEGHTDEVCDLKAAAAGSLVLSGSSDKTVRLWDLRTGSGCVRIIEGHSEVVWSVDMDGHCRTAVSGSKDKTVKLWDLGSGRCLETFEGHDDSSGVLDVVMHDSGSSFLSSGHDSTIVNAWAVGSTRAIMPADMASSCMPDTDANRLFANRDFSTVAFCSLSPGQLGLSVWR